MIPELPEDILHLLCAELGERSDFDTLYQCAVSSKSLARAAISSLYRAHHTSPVRGGGSEAVPIAQQRLVVQKWSILWRSIVASSRGLTLFPYCRYIRVLDLRDLESLFDDDKFKGAIAQRFFSGELSSFRKQASVGRTRKGQTRLIKILDVVATLDAIGDEVTRHTPMLEKITGKVFSRSLLKWSPRLPQLSSLELYNGDALGDDETQAQIHKHCPNFDALGIYTWQAFDSDHKLSTFFTGMRPNRLRIFEGYSDIGVGPETCRSLNHHSASLRELRLDVRSDTLRHLALLKNCTALKTIQLNSIDWTEDLEITDPQAFSSIVDWLQDCKALRNLSITSFPFAPNLVLPLLLADHGRLRRLEVGAYVATHHRNFHMALSTQTSLQSLFLNGEGEGMGRDDLDILVDSVKNLRGLRKLTLGGVSDFFRDEHINAIVLQLTELEDLFVSGLHVSDEVLVGISTLRNLRSVTFTAMSSFTFDGLLEFISSLGQGNQGIEVRVDNADPDSRLTTEEETLIRETLTAKSGGRFDYTLYRDPDVSEFEGESD